MLAKGGNEQAITTLIDRYKMYVKIIGRQFFLTGGETDDIIQEGMMGLYGAIYSYNLTSSANFKTFAKMCIRRSIQSAVKGANRQKHRPLNEYVSVNFNDSENDETLGLIIPSQNSDPEQRLIHKQQREKIEQIIKNALSDFEKAVLENYLKGNSYFEISQLLNKDIKSIDNALLRIKKKLLDVE